MNKITIIRVGGVDLFRCRSRDEHLVVFGSCLINGGGSGRIELSGGTMPQMTDEQVRAGLTREEGPSLDFLRFVRS